MAFEYQNTKRFFAQMMDESRGIALRELARLGARNTEMVKRGIYFEADHASLYRINYASRFISRVHAPLVSFPCHSTKYLYKKAGELPWAALFSVKHTFAIFSNVSNSKITHSRYASLVLKDAIVDRFRKHFGKRPSIDRTDPDVFINLHINHNHATISLETSGGSLHRRGYRKESLEAPMQETVAAAVVQMSHWDGKKPLYDPMCGTGTLLCEALMSYCRIPPGYLRTKFGFQHLPDYDDELWQSTKSELDAKIRDLPTGLIFGSDIAQEAIDASNINLQQLPTGTNVTLERRDIREIDGIKNAIVIMNPPYGVRMESDGDIGILYGHIEDFLRSHCSNVEAYIYFGNRSHIKKINIKPVWKKPLKNGGLDGRLVKYVIS